MPGLRHKYLLYGFLAVSGMICVGLAYQQYRYTRFLSAGHRAVLEQRFDSQDYEQASHLWFASQARLLFNQGVLAYKAGHLPSATEFFRRSSQRAVNPALQTRALYNLSVVLLEMQEVQGAMALLKEALRLEPGNKEAKFALEQLYQLVQREGEEHREAAGSEAKSRPQERSETLQQAPGVDQEAGKNSSGDGQGHATGRPGI